MTTSGDKIASTSTEITAPSARRQLNGTAFLTLEHIGYFALVVLLPGVLLAGVAAALELWASKGSNLEVMALGIPNIVTTAGLSTAGAIGVVALLLVMVPLAYCLRSRLSAEYKKRPGYTGRVAYKLPVYAALGLLVAATLALFTVMLYVFLNSLALIGVSDASIGDMYLGQFVPALLGLIAYGMAGWYVMWFAKGRDASRMFMRIISLLGAVMVIALFVTALTVNHDTKNRGNGGGPVRTLPYPIQNDNTYNY